jgi:hypothetical protein
LTQITSFSLHNDKAEVAIKSRKVETMKRTGKTLFIIGLVIAAFLLIGAVVAFIILFPMIKLAHMEKGG